MVTVSPHLTPFYCEVTAAKLLLHGDDTQPTSVGVQALS